MFTFRSFCVLLIFIVCYACQPKKETETVTEYFPGTQLASSVFEVKDGKRNGPCVSFYRNRNKEKECTYVDGLEEGKVTYYYEQGGVSKEINKKKGQPDGLSTYYTMSGKINRTETFKNGVRQGPMVTYYSNGKVHEKFNYFQWKFDGEQTEYYDNGQLKFHAFYEKGMPALGLEEFSKGGKAIDNSREIEVEKVDMTKEESVFYVKCKLIPYSAKDTYYQGEPEEEKYFPATAVKMYIENQMAVRAFEAKPGQLISFTSHVLVVTQSALGHDMLVYKKVAVSNLK